jgi:hypothetical protein
VKDFYPDLVKEYVIDFSPGLHGHFLEYVLNRYIFQIETRVKSIFQSTGACHPINTDKVYQDKKLIHRGHYSAFENPYPIGIKKVIFIDHDPELDFVMLCNIYHRCHPDSVNAEDFNVEEINEMHESMTLLDNKGRDHYTTRDFKNDWYAKLMERHFEHASRQPVTDLPVMKFGIKSFFNLYDFLLEIRRAANFLDHTFNFDKSLIDLWYEFISRNQGYQAWAECRKLFELIVSGADVDIVNDWKIHAYLNYQISKVFHLYDHPRLFAQETYPTSTREIHDIIADHVNKFDQRW